jgi:hypothetical protein
VKSFVIGPVLCVAAIVAGCGGKDDEFEISVLSPLPVEAFIPASMGDPCSGVGLSGCEFESITRVDLLKVDDPSIAEVELRGDEPGEKRPRFNVRALREGRTTIRAKATFDDGSRRETSAELRVLAIDRIEVTLGCIGVANAGVTAHHLVRWGESVGLTLNLFGRGERLPDVIPDAVEVEGLDQRTFTAPAREATLPLASRFVASTGVIFETFGPERITDLVLTPSDILPRPGKRVSVSGALRVGDASPCAAGPVDVTTATPSICMGPDGESDWSLEDADFYSVTALSEGRCTLQITPVGGATLDVGFDLRVRRD